MRMTIIVIFLVGSRVCVVSSDLFTSTPEIYAYRQAVSSNPRSRQFSAAQKAGLKVRTIFENFEKC